MKRNFTAASLFLLAIGLFTVNTATAQVEWGVTAGFNFANMTGKKYGVIADSTRPKFSGITRIRIGLFADMPINNYWSFNPGIAYSVKGGIQKLDSAYTEVLVNPGWADKSQTVANIDLTYIEFPLLIRFSTPLGNPSALYPHENSVKPFYLDVFAGLNVAYLLSAKNSWSSTFTRTSAGDTTEAYNFSIKTKKDEDLKKIKKFNIGPEFGIGFKWRFNRKSYLYIEGRYTMHLLNINNGFWDRWVANPDFLVDPNKPPFVAVKPTIKNAGTAHVTIGFITNFSKRRYFNLYKPDKNRP